MQASLSICSIRRAVVLFLPLICFSRRTAGGPHEARLLRKKFVEGEYLVTSRPVANDNDTVTVTFGLSLLQIRDVDMKNEVLRSNLWLQYKWQDYQLAWNESEFGGVPSIVIPASSIWTPDLLLYNSADKDIDSKISTNVAVWSNGTCLWIPPGLFQSSCSIDISWFPFDDQLCFLKFGSWTYNGYQLDLRLYRDRFDTSNYVSNGEWSLIEAPAIRNVRYYQCCIEPYPDLTFSVLLRRRALYYNLYLIVPTASVAGLTLLAFLLPPDSGEKIGLVITVLLSMTVFQLIVAEKVPESSHSVPLIAMFVGVVMFFCTVSLLMSVIVLNLHHRTPKTHYMPNWVRVVFCDWLAWLLRMKRSGHDVSLTSLRDGDQSRRHSMFEEASHSLDKHLPSMLINKEMTTDDMIGDMGVGGATAQLAIIAAELRQLTARVREDGRDKKVSSEWRFVAMVVDRLCFCIFTVFFIIATVVVFRRQLF